MATHTFVDLDIPEAHLLADLNGISYDLRKAAEVADMVKTAIEKLDFRLLEPLSIAATTYYSRPFMEGTRQRLSAADLSSFTTVQLAAHDTIRTFRDKHVAHSVNGFEDNQPTAMYTVETVQTEGIQGIGCNHSRVAGLTVGQCKDLIEISTILGRHVDTLMELERSKLLPLVRGMPLDRVLSAGNKLFAALSAPIRKPRKRIGKQQRTRAGRR
jgi:hypothetical protein